MRRPGGRRLNAFKDREMFRIDMRHILGHTREFWDFAVELTDLAEVVVNAAYHLCHEDLRVVYGTPCLDSALRRRLTAHAAVSEMSVCALGKCGGRELGFASDIELMFVYSGNGKTSGPQVITSTEFYEKLVQNFVRVIRARREGIFEIDLQLRPYGKAGQPVGLAGCLPALLCPGRPGLGLRAPGAGQAAPGGRQPRLGRKDRRAARCVCLHRRAVRRDRHARHARAPGPPPGDGRDVQPEVQPGRAGGCRIPGAGLADHVRAASLTGLRQTNTREAMAALAAANILAPEDYTRLRKAHTFLRWLIDSLRVVRGNARDVTVPPEGSEEFAFLARRMQYGGDTQRLRDELIRYTADVQEINQRLLGK